MPVVVYQSVLWASMAILLAFELTRPAFRAELVRPSRPGRRARNLAYLVSATAVGACLQGLGAFARGIVPALVDWRGPAVFEIACCFLAAELLGWVLHWVKHKSAYLWRLHFQHHRETNYDIWLVTHTHGFEVLVSGTFTAFVLAGLGFSPLALDTYLLFYAIANTYQHSSRDLTLGPLDYLIVSPSYHRLHHAVGSDSNFGNTLTVWDVVFHTATWPKSRRAPDVEIGIGDGPEPWGFGAEMLYFLEPVSRVLGVTQQPSPREPLLHGAQTSTRRAGPASAP